MHSVDGTLRFGRSLPEARGALILLHGRGSSAEDIAGLAQSLAAEDFACLAPSAENGTWYPQRFFVPLHANEPWLTHALNTVEQLVSELMQAGLSSERIGIIGFSQGACLALEHNFRSGRRYAFTAGLSGALIGPLDAPRGAHDLRRTPILLGCAENDAHIPREYVEASANVLQSANAEVTTQIYRGSAHTVFPQEIAWINDQLVHVRV